MRWRSSIPPVHQESFVLNTLGTSGLEFPDHFAKVRLRGMAMSTITWTSHFTLILFHWYRKPSEGPGFPRRWSGRIATLVVLLTDSGREPCHRVFPALRRSQSRSSNLMGAC